MEKEPRSPTEFIPRPVIDTDLEPLYQLKEAQYQSVINRLANLLGEVAQRLQQSGNNELSCFVTEQGYETLRDYDDDVSLALRWIGKESNSEVSTFGGLRVRERIADIEHKLNTHR